MKGARKIAAQALAITSQEWSCLGFGVDPHVAPSGSVDVITERIVSLLAIRTVAVLSTLDDFDDFSTTTICRTILLDDTRWPQALGDELVDELRFFVKRIIQGYNDTPYHNREHAYHVVLSANKLLDLMLLNPNSNASVRYAMVNGTGNHSQISRRSTNSFPVPRTFGLRRDTLLQFSLMFAALIHDVKHGGVSNRQLVWEEDAVAIIYNDASVLEHQSLCVGFTELLQPEFAKFRAMILPTREIYSGFRQTVVDLVLATDIANPERMQITKDKWKTAFGDADQMDDTAKRESAISEINLERESRRRSIGSMFSDISVDPNVLNALNAADEASLSTTPESSDHDVEGKFGGSTLSGSFEGCDTLSSDGRIGSRLHYHTAESQKTPSLKKIEELGRSEAVGVVVPENNKKNSNGVDKVISLELGYSKQNGNRCLEARAQSSPTRAHASISQTPKSTHVSRGGSTSTIPDGIASLVASRGISYRRRRASVAAGDNLLKRMQQRLSASSSKTTGDIVSAKRFRQRLGIMRSVDLGGELVENFSRKSSICIKSKKKMDESDEPDELRSTVILETMLLSCDVAHNLQGWDHMLKWSQRLYWELQDANKAGRGFDPAPGWESGQAGFLQGYMLPLAQRLGGTGVFGHSVGSTFAHIVQDILDQWGKQGRDITEMLINNRDLDLVAWCSSDRSGKN